MKKLLLSTILVGISAVSFAYTANIKNQSNVAISINAAGSTKCTIAANSSTSCNLDAYTTYQATYPGQYSTQGLFTIQKNSYQVLQVTPVTPSSAVAEFIIDVNADNKYNGSVDTFMTSSGEFSYNGSCRADSGGVTCQLSNGDNLQTLNLTLTSSYVPPVPTPSQTPVKTASGMYIYQGGNWDSSTTYAPYWSNDVNATLYPEVTQNSQTYAACYQPAVGEDPAKDISQGWGPWVQFSNSQSANPCDPATVSKQKAPVASGRSFW